MNNKIVKIERLTKDDFLYNINGYFYEKSNYQECIENINNNPIKALSIIPNFASGLDFDDLTIGEIVDIKDDSVLLSTCDDKYINEPEKFIALMNFKWDIEDLEKNGTSLISSLRLLSVSIERRDVMQNVIDIYNIKRAKHLKSKTREK